MVDDNNDLVLPDLAELMGSMENNDPINPNAHGFHKIDENELPEFLPNEFEYSSNESNIETAEELSHDDENFDFEIEDEPNSDDSNFDFEIDDNELDNQKDNFVSSNDKNKESIENAEYDDFEFTEEDNSDNEEFDFEDAFNVNIPKDNELDQSFSIDDENFEEHLFTDDEDNNENSWEDDSIDLNHEDNNIHDDTNLHDKDAAIYNEPDDENEISLNDEDSDDDNVMVNEATKDTKNKKNKDFKNKFDKFKKQALAELKGGNASDVDDSMEDDADNTDNDEINASEGSELNNDDEINKKGKGKNASKAKIPAILTKPISFVKNIYNKVINFVIKILQTILNFLGKIPVIGKPFKILADKVKYLKIIANLLPLLLILMIIIHMHNNAVNNHTSISGPDGGAGSITNMSYDNKNNSVKAHIKNDGDVILDITPKFTLYTSKITNPGSWIHPKIEATCIGNKINIDIDAEKDIIVKCKTKPQGIDVKVSGEAEND